MKKYNTLIVISLLIALSTSLFAGCGNEEKSAGDAGKAEVNTSAATTTVEATAATEATSDAAAETTQESSTSESAAAESSTTESVEAPESEESEEAEEEAPAKEKDEDMRIACLSPPIYSMLCAMGLQDNVVGVNPRSIKMANPRILSLIHPDYAAIDSKFVSADFKVNKESLLQLEPSIVLIYGKFQDDGLTNLDIPVENMAFKELDSEKITIFWEEKLAELLGVENEEKMAKAWAKTHEVIDAKKAPEDMKALYILKNMKGISVSGKNSYGDAFLKSIGLINVAEDVEGFNQGAGQADVSAEQINEWNPDIIYVGSGSGAKDILAGKGPAAAIANVNAVKNGKVFDIPKGIGTWAVPCSDAPLMPLWMLSCVDENLYSKDDLHAAVRDFYKEVYGIELKDELLNEIFEYERPGN